MKKNIAVIGCGYWGKNLVRNFSELGALKYVCDQDKDLVSKMAFSFGVESKDYQDILEDKDIDGVVIASPAYLHADLAIKALEMKKNVFVEKQLSLNKEEATRMISSAKKNDMNLMVGHLLQYHPIFKKIREIVELGELGKLMHVSSSRKSMGKIRSEENVIWSFAPHDISMILSLTPQKIKNIHSDKATLLQEGIADIARVGIEFDQGLKADINISWISPFKEQKLVVTCEKAILVFDDTLEWKKKLMVVKYHYENLQNQLSISKDEPSFIEVPMSEPLRNECEHFIETIKNKNKPITDGEEGLEVLKILSAC